MVHGVNMQVVGVIAAALEQHAAHAVPSQNGTVSVGMQAASGVSKVSAAQHDSAATAVAANGDVSAVAVEVRSMELMQCFGARVCLLDHLQATWCNPSATCSNSLEASPNVLLVSCRSMPFLEVGVLQVTTFCSAKSWC